MTYVDRLLTNGAYAKRTITPVALACIHITANSRTASNPDLHEAADDERDYANRAGSGGPSAHFYVARDGWAIRAIDPGPYWAWSNGDVNSPNRDNPGIVRVLGATKAKGINVNQAYWLEFENVGYGSSYPVNAAQKQFCAEQIAAMAKRKGMKVNRETVHGHWEINGVDRRNCPAPYASRETFLKDVIARANRILNPPEATDMPALTSYLGGQSATVAPGKNVRSAPTLSATVLRVTSAPESWTTLLGWVKGELDDECGSDQWIVRWNGGYEYTSKCNLSAGPALPTDSTPYSEAQVAAKVLEARRTQYDADKAAADADPVVLGPRP